MTLVRTRTEDGKFEGLRFIRVETGNTVRMIDLPGEQNL
jgi:hypothetical protein